MKDAMLRRPKVECMTGLRRSTIYKLMSEGLFPRPIKLTGRAVAWSESEVAAWLESRKAERPNAA